MIDGSFASRFLVGETQWNVIFLKQSSKRLSREFMEQVKVETDGCREALNAVAIY